LKEVLLVVLGPTAVGKTAVAIDIARGLGAEIVSADSRQFYRGLGIGTAAPSPEEQARARHHFVGHLAPTDYYNVSSYERDVLDFLGSYFQSRPVAVMAGGSGLYIDAVCKGIDVLPDPDEALRASLKQELAEKGLDHMGERLRALDRDYHQVVDLRNPNRVLRALEVCIATGKPFSALRRNDLRPRPFNIVKIGLNRPREELVERIHHRVDTMIAEGLVEEVRSLAPYRHENALNTVGYKEIFRYLDGESTLEEAMEKIKTNTRRYAKRQMTWFNRDKEIHWFHPDDRQSIRDCLAREGGPGLPAWT
jgi:tRNA dimethylallyltransferase